MRAVLKELMRHASVDTTLRFYVKADGDKTAEDLLEKHAVGSDLGSCQESPPDQHAKTP